MAMVPVVLPPVPWTNQEIVLFHGTINLFEAAILAVVSVRRGDRFTDFGRGFYTTTNLWQAQAWAWQTSQKNPGSQPRVIELTIARDTLARLDALWFVRGAPDAEDYWSLVHRCRTLGTHHGRAVKQGWYDVVIGPVARSWRQRDAFPDADQIGFHTTRAAHLLDASSKRVLP
jgi:hypothetical protein